MEIIKWFLSIVISVIASHLSGGAMKIYMIPVMIFLPLLIGAVVGIPTGFFLKKCRNTNIAICVMGVGSVMTSVIGILCNKYLMPSPVLNFMLMGMAYSAVFSNLIPEERLIDISKSFEPMLAVSMIIVILNLGAPLDYHAIGNAGLYTFIYIAARATGLDEKVHYYMSYWNNRRICSANGGVPPALKRRLYYQSFKKAA